MRRTLLGCTAAALLLTPLAACGGDDDDTGTPPTSADPGDAASLRVGGLDSLDFDADEYTIEAGDIHVVYDNEGSVAHTLLIRQDSDDVEDFKLSISGSDTDEGDITLEPGTYTLYCDVAGHEAAGMVAELTVE